MAWQFGRVLGNPQASGGVFRVPMDGQDIDRPGAAVQGIFSFWLPSGSVVSCPCPAVPGSLRALVNLSRHWRVLSLSSGSRSTVSGSG